MGTVYKGSIENVIVRGKEYLLDAIERRGLEAPCQIAYGV